MKDEIGPLFIGLAFGVILSLVLTIIVFGTILDPTEYYPEGFSTLEASDCNVTAQNSSLLITWVSLNNQLMATTNESLEIDGNFSNCAYFNTNGKFIFFYDENGELMLMVIPTSMEYEPLTP